MQISLANSTWRMSTMAKIESRMPDTFAIAGENVRREDRSPLSRSFTVATTSFDSLRKLAKIFFTAVERDAIEGGRTSSMSSLGDEDPPRECGGGGRGAEPRLRFLDVKPEDE